jgi:serine/threonine-protein kinase
MADVYLGVIRGPTDFTKLAVVKRLRSHLAEDPEFLEMFLQEARIAARLNHPNVVQTFEVGQEESHHFIAMEYLQGHPYSRFMSRIGREKIDFAVHLRILIETLEGLQHAHDLKDFDGRPLGLVHRDVSPQNIFITYDGQIKLLDFGIAKAFDSAVETRTGVIKGKLSYMSPEQALAGKVDRRSDLYSVGVMLWEAAARKRRWKNLSNIQMLHKLASPDEPIDLPTLAGQELSDEIEAALRKALARDPADRYPNASDFLEDLEKMLDKIGRVSARDVGKLVAERFKADRERIDAVIETELKKLNLTEASNERSGTFGSLPRPDSAGSGPSNTLVSPSTPARTTQHSTSVSLPEPESSARPKKSRRIWFVAAAVVTGVAVAAVLKLSRPIDQPSPAQAADPAQKMVRVKLSALPAQAQLYFDGKRLGDNPYSAELLHSDRHVLVRAECPGHESQEREVSLTKEVDVRFELKALPNDGAATSASDKKTARRAQVWRGRVAAPSTTKEPVETKEPPPIETAPKVEPPPRKKQGAALDSKNPWE